MNTKLKKFIEDNKTFIQQNKFEDLYSQCEESIRGELTTVLHTVGIDPIEHLTTLYTGMFRGVDVGTRFIIPKNVQMIEPLAFSNCVSLISVEIPDGFTHLPSNCFHYCTSLKVVSLPNTIKYIGTACFAYTTLDHIEYRGTVSEFEKTKLNSKIKWKEYSPLMYRSGKIHCVDGVV